MTVLGLDPGSLFGLVLATATVTLTLLSKVFRGAREAVGRRWPGAGALFTCAFCMSHWVAMGLAAILLWPSTWRGLFQLVAAWWITVALAAPVMAMVVWSHGFIVVHRNEEG